MIKFFFFNVHFLSISFIMTYLNGPLMAVIGDIYLLYRVNVRMYMYRIRVYIIINQNGNKISLKIRKSYTIYPCPT